MSATIRFPGLVAMCIVFVSVGAVPQSAATPGQEQRVYEYKILREGDPVGSHQVLIESREDLTRVVSQSLVEIGLLGLTFYRFHYESEEEWDAQGLRRLTVRVDDDGELLEIDGSREGEQFKWSLNDQDTRTQDMPVFPTNHWNPAVLSQTRVLNTLTGGINRISVQPQQEESLKLDEGITEVKSYRYSGDLHLDSWYDSSGRWMGMRFEGQDGSMIEYHCRNCKASRSL